LKAKRVPGPNYQSLCHIWCESVQQESLAIAKMTARCALYNYKLFTLILFTLTATILCADFDAERDAERI